MTGSVRIAPPLEIFTARGICDIAAPGRSCPSPGAGVSGWGSSTGHHLDTLRRAVAFIDEYAHTDITPADIAAAHVTIRAVQPAFRRRLDTTPTDYLRRVRLDRAHHDLIAADSARDSVTAVAYRWGFPARAGSPTTAAPPTACRPATPLRRC